MSPLGPIDAEIWEFDPNPSIKIHQPIILTKTVQKI